MALHLLTEHLLEEWSLGSFAKDPPNATVSVLSKNGTWVRHALVELRDPHLEGDRLTFNVRVLEGELAGHRAAVYTVVLRRRRATHGPPRLLVRGRRSRGALLLPALRVPANLLSLSLPSSLLTS
jgi:hypothetical protein